MKGLVYMKNLLLGLASTFFIIYYGCSPVAPLPDEQAVSDAKKAELITYAQGDNANSVTRDINLLANGPNDTYIQWVTSDYKHIDASRGRVYRPTFGEGDIAVTLTATITKGEAIDSLTIYQTVKEDTSTVIDIDGNVYYTTTIGNQVWLRQNLKTTRYNDGMPIPNVLDSIEWSGLNSGALCWYKNDSLTYCNPYGALYNWYAVNTGKLAPKGWHVATDSDWSILLDRIDPYAAGNLRDTSSIYWLFSYPGVDNLTGFSAVAAGNRTSTGRFINIKMSGWWWTSSEYNPTSSRYIGIYGSTSTIERNYYEKSMGFSVRCVKD